ncbi:Transferase [Macleaya cordata]|uniref:Transferase n=1 Tax=Macleaya cordata TaxID=56857 RepID=A0A200QEE4_MACCD|nr:Transferase [Macleaya cordata]
MAIGLINNTILKPYCSSSSSDEQSVIPNDVLVPLTIFDKAAFDLHVAVLYAFKPPIPSNEVMKETLSKVLDHYPHLAGRFTTDNYGRTCILLNNACLSKARGLDLEECTQVRVAVNGRARIKPAVLMEYFGNLVLWAYPKLKVKEFAKAIHDEVTRVDNKYFKSFIDIGEIIKGDREELEAMAPEIGNTLCVWRWRAG